MIIINRQETDCNSVMSPALASANGRVQNKPLEPLDRQYNFQHVNQNPRKTEVGERVYPLRGYGGVTSFPAEEHHW